MFFSSIICRSGALNQKTRSEPLSLILPHLCQHLGCVPCSFPDLGLSVWLNSSSSSSSAKLIKFSPAPLSISRLIYVHHQLSFSLLRSNRSFLRPNPSRWGEEAKEHVLIAATWTQPNHHHQQARPDGEDEGRRRETRAKFAFFDHSVEVEEWELVEEKKK